MARPASIESGGYFATPPHLIPLIAEHLTVGEGSEFNYADPCAGDGAAVIALQEALGGSGTLYTCELEARRHAGLVKRLEKQCWRSREAALHGDAFLVEYSRGSVSLLFLNPPYDVDPLHGRLEQRFLARFTPALTEGGVLVLIVPHYALEASAQLLAREYDNVQCFRFPKEDFAAFKQVVVFASKTETRLGPDQQILARVQAWAKGIKGVPLLGSRKETHEIRGSYHRSPTWRIGEIDLQSLVAKARP